MDGYYDENLEIELQHLELPDNIKSKLYEDIDIYFSDDDFIAQQENKIKQDKSKSKKQNKINDDEINSFTQMIHKNIEAEVLKEEKDNYQLLSSVDPEDRLRAQKLLETDPILKKAFDCGLVAMEELVFLIDYYEMYSLINKSQTKTINCLNEIGELYQEEDVWGDLKTKLEKTISVTNAILNNNFDFNTEEISDTNENTAKSPIKQKEPVNDLKASKTLKIKNKDIDNANKAKSNSSNNFFESQKIKNNNKTNNLQTKSIVKDKIKPLTSKIPLYSEDNKITNLPATRENRKIYLEPLIKQIRGKSELFKFETLKPVNKNDTDLDFQAIHNKMREIYPKLNETNKSSTGIKNKIEQAKNFSKR